MPVTFADRLGAPSNRAALAFHAALDTLAADQIGETSTSPASDFVRFDPLHLSHADLPAKRKLWRIPCVYGTDLAPQPGGLADAAGLSKAQAMERPGSARVRVLAIGFAPGQPLFRAIG